MPDSFYLPDQIIRDLIVGVGIVLIWIWLNVMIIIDDVLCIALFDFFCDWHRHQFVYLTQFSDRQTTGREMFVSLL